MDVNKKYQAAVYCSTEDMIAQSPHEESRPAIADHEWVRCWKCGTKLGRKIEPHGIGEFTGESATAYMRQQEPRFTKRVSSHSNAFEMKCKSRPDRAKYCNAVNVISL